jgi:hypothetical protein
MGDMPGLVNFNGAELPLFKSGSTPTASERSSYDSGVQVRPLFRLSTARGHPSFKAIYNSILLQVIDSATSAKRHPLFPAPSETTTDPLPIPSTLIHQGNI